MLRVLWRLRHTFSSVKEEYSRHFIIKLHFQPDGYYESSNLPSTKTNIGLSSYSHWPALRRRARPSS